MHRYRLFDVDGTLTQPGHDLWYHGTRSLVADPVAFDAAVVDWKRAVAAGAEVQAAARRMMQRGLDLLPVGIDGAAVRSGMATVAGSLMARGAMRCEAMDYLLRSLQDGYVVVLCTTNYLEGARGLLDAVRDADLLTQATAARLVLTGSLIDWPHLRIRHFNMGEAKLDAVSRATGVRRARLPALVDASFGDDPLGNDSELLAAAGERAFVIPSPTNAGCARRRLPWEDIVLGDYPQQDPDDPVCRLRPHCLVRGRGICRPHERWCA